MIEIQTLSVKIPQADVQAALVELPADQMPVKDLALRFSREGVHVSGKYPVMMMKVAFETLWIVQAEGGRLRVELSTLNLAGLPVSTFRATLMRVAQTMVRQQPGLSLEGETVFVDVGEVLRDRKVPVSMYVSKVTTDEGLMHLEANAPT